MDKKVTQANVVVLATNHNPGILSPDFMKNYKLVTEEPTNFVHTPMATVLEYKNFSFAVLPDRYAASLTGSITPESLQNLVRIVSQYFKILPVTPVTACGLNLHASISFETRETEKGHFSYLEPHNPLGLEQFNVVWGTTALFPWNGENAIVTMKVEPLGDKTESSLLMNAHMKGDATASIGLLERYHTDYWKLFMSVLERI